MVLTLFTSFLPDLTPSAYHEFLDLIILVGRAFIELKKNIIKDVISPLGLDLDLWMKTYDKLSTESE